MTIAATHGDLDIIGSQVNGKNVTLAASHDLNLLSQAEQHTDRSSSHNASGEVGVSIGETTGIYLSVAAGEALAHGNGTTHDDTVVNAANDLTLISGNDTTIRGAEAKGHSVLANIGGNLDIASEQDTDDYSSHSLQAGLTLVYGFGGSGVGVSGSLAASKANSHYASVTQMSGIGAGSGGFDIHVHGNTDLTGAVIASTASADKNLLDTGSLTYSNLQNEAKSSAESLSVGGGYGTGQFAGMKGFSGSIGIPQDSDQSSTTQAGIANGTIVVRDNLGQSLTGLDRNPSLANANGVTNGFDPQKVAENQQAGQLAGQVGMTAAGDIEQATGMQSGSAGAIALHTVVGGAAAALGGGDAMQGALGAGASEAASEGVGQYLADHGIDPNSAEGKGLMDLASTAIGAAVGQGAGAATALQGEKYNEQLHANWIKYIHDTLAARFAQENGISVQEAQNILLREAMRLTDATNQRYLDNVDAVDSVAMQGKAEEFLEANDAITPTGMLYNLSPSVADFNDPHLGAYDLRHNNPAEYEMVLEAMTTDNSSAESYQAQWQALDGMFYSDAGPERGRIAAQQNEELVGKMFLAPIVMGGSLAIGNPEIGGIFAESLAGTPVVGSVAEYALATRTGVAATSMAVNATAQAIENHGHINPIDVATSGLAAYLGMGRGFVWNIALGAGASATNAEYSNVVNGSDQSVWISAVTGGSTAGFGYGVGKYTTYRLSSGTRRLLGPVVWGNLANDITTETTNRWIGQLEWSIDNNQKPKGGK